LNFYHFENYRKLSKIIAEIIVIDKSICYRTIITIYQVEQLQNSLAGVMQFMSAFNSVEAGGMSRGMRQSEDEASTADTVSFSYFQVKKSSNTALTTVMY
jgi:hypothetical protein